MSDKPDIVGIALLMGVNNLLCVLLGMLLRTLIF